MNGAWDRRVGAPPSLVDGTEFGREGAFALAQRALALRAGAAPVQAPGRSVCAVFLNPSLRTRASLEAACARLAVHPIVLQPGKDAWALETRDGAIMDGPFAEHVADAVSVLSQFADVVAVRAFAGLTDLEEDRSEPVLSAFVRYSRVPVVNLESAMGHPLQGLADTATWVSRLGPDLRGRKITLRWAPHPRALPQAVPHQVLLSAALMGMDVTVAHPEGFDLDPRILDRARALSDIRVTHDPDLSGAEVVYAKSWSGTSGYGRREAESAARAALGGWTVDADHMARTARAGFMHCLPVRRNVVVTDEVIDGADSWVQEQAGLRLWTALAVFERLLGGT